MDSQQVFLVPQVPPLPPASSKVHQQQQTTTQMLQQQQQPQPPQCSICGTTQKLLRCAKCKAIYYCSTDHQHLDWPTHKQECRALAKQRQINNRLQQLTNGCGAININAHSNSSNSSSTNITSSWSSNFATTTAATTPANDNLQHMQQNLKTKHLDGAFVLGTHENEILNSKAEIVAQNSNSSEYMGNIEANSTTTDQMHNILGQNLLDPPYSMQSYNDNSYYYQTVTTQLDKGQVEQQPLLSQLDQNQYNPSDSLAATYAPPPPILDQQQPRNNLQQMAVHQQPQQAGYMPQPQTTLQYPVPQLSNYLINQHEKSSSYQIGAAIVDENLFENANERRYEELCRNIISDMNQYGLSVVDDFLGREKGLQILNEVHKMYSAGVFKDGQLVNNMKSEQDLRTIRGDKITWVKGVERGCSNVGYLINQIDAVICRANSMRNNGKLGDYVIKERTKAMVACYPGSGSHYVMHVDNPNKDGRVITAIYYLNLDWDSRNSGGVLRIFPEQTKSVADIEPKFDRLIFFWSDKRNPHEVQPAHRTRYAITVWYFDANEREQALNRCKNSQNSNTTNNSNNSNNSGSASNNSNTESNSTAATDATASSNSTTSSTSSSSSNTNCPASSPSSPPSIQSSASATTNDNFKNPAATTSTIQNSTRPIQVVRPNSYK